MEIKLIPCPLCTTPHFDGVNSLRITLVRIATNLVQCPVCPETLLGLDKFTIHLFSHIEDATHLKSDDAHKQIENQCANSSESPVKCDICNFSFSDKHILDIHQKLLHQTTPDQTTGNYSYHCHLCSKQFKMRGSLMVHLRVAHYGFVRKESYTGCIEKDVCAKIENVQNGDSCGLKCDKNGQGKFPDNKQWECDVCSKLFTTKYFLKKHKRLHTGEMPYCCSLCHKSFTFQQSYHKHMLYHSSEKPHVCNECGRAFKELSTLQNHSRIHSGERPFVCETCGKCFRQRVSYLVHRRIHTGVMPYKCTTCDKTFRYKVSQKSHKCPNSSENHPTEPNVSENIQIVARPILSAPQGEDGASQVASKCIMNVDLNTGSISVIPSEQKARTTDNNLFVNRSMVQKKSVVLNNNEFVEITYNKSDLITTSTVSASTTDSIEVPTKINDSESNDGFHKLIYAEEDKQLFSPTLSNLLPDVESLYLNSSPSNSLNIPVHQETINDMREKCLEEFLQGME